LATSGGSLSLPSGSPQAPWASKTGRGATCKHLLGLRTL